MDIAGDGVPPAQFLSFKNNPAYKGLMVTGDQLQTGYVTMKTTLPPFDNLKVRRGGEHGGQQRSHRAHH